jgi:hypothetical protein
MDYKVFVTLGFHINFYHSWRGDTPDEAGFGTDIRVAREVLRMLDHAQKAGLKARAYWDTEVYWTFQEILPRYAPDIIEGIRSRVQAGWDEIVLGPFNNGATHAATGDEFRAALAWALENPWGSGLKQVFGRVAPFFRAQETMFTTGQEAILKEQGIEGLILYYAGVPFNTISNFIPALTHEQRYNPLWFRSHEDQPALILLPAIAAGDLIEQVSLEALMLDLHRRQQRGEIQSDVLIHINEDADLETWLPVKLPKALSWFPNLGGLEEFIRVVNKYPWADFTLPSEYAAGHPPRSEVIVRQDLADGGFDGSYSWAEKYASLRIWTLLEQARLASYRAEILARRAGLNLDTQLWEGMQSSFFQRLIGQSTTHFGMSTPIINEERQNRAFAILSQARQTAEAAEQVAARAVRRQSTGGLYDFEVYPTPPSRGEIPSATCTAVSLPVVLPGGVRAVALEDSQGQPIPASLTDLVPLPDGRTGGRVRFVGKIEPDKPLRLRVSPAVAAGGTMPVGNHLKNHWLDITFSKTDGIERIAFNGKEFGTRGFLDPFITYDRKVFRSAGYEFLPLPGEIWDGLERVRLKTHIPMQTPEGAFSSELEYTFTLFNDLPYLYVDVEARYAYTPPRQVIHNLTQKLRRLMDLRWIETAPFQLTPALTAPAAKPLRIWKHNYLGVTAWYDLNYGQINPKNSSLDSFNHQVTAGWVAVSNGQEGILLGENAASLASMAFCPMRLEEQHGNQTISLNPFGSYFGRQLDYSHLGGNGNGKVIMQAFSGALQPNGPSYNGETLRFSLLLAPYSGDEPPQELQDAAAAHFYPPGVIVHAAPAGVDAATGGDIERFIASEQQRMRLGADLPLDPPTAFLVNPSANAVDLVWDAPRAGPVTGFQVAWRLAGEGEWQTTIIEALTRWHLGDLKDGQAMQFKIRCLRGDSCSPWTAEQTCASGAVTDSSVTSMFSSVPLRTLLRIVGASIWSVIKAR